MTENHYVYQSSRYGTLMREYSTLSGDNAYIEWGKKAQEVVAYMQDAISKVSMSIAYEKRRLEKESDSNARVRIEMGLSQYESFRKIVQQQINNLIEVMDNLPTGSVKPIVKEIDKSQMITADTPYVKIFVRKSGDIILDNQTVSLENLSDALRDFVSKKGLVLYAREPSSDAEAPMEIVKAVLGAVMQNRLSIKLCDESGFSDAIDSSGKLRVES